MFPYRCFSLYPDLLAWLAQCEHDSRVFSYGVFCAVLSYMGIGKPRFPCVESGAVWLIGVIA